MTTETMTIAAFIAKHGLTMTVESIPHRSDRDPSATKKDREWDAKAGHWRVTIIGRDTRFKHVCEYSMGSGSRVWKKGAAAKVRMGGSHYIESERRDVQDGKPVQQKYWMGRTLHILAMVNELSEPMPPTLEMVLDSLAMDADGWTNTRDFASWCADYGLDTDSRKAEAAYKACGETAKGLRFLLGDDAYNELRTNVERL
jgi:hypothetical protein